jgi:hypothetical protein
MGPNKRRFVLLIYYGKYSTNYCEIPTLVVLGGNKGWFGNVLSDLMPAHSPQDTKHYEKFYTANRSRLQALGRFILRAVGHVMHVGNISKTIL